MSDVQTLFLIAAAATAALAIAAAAGLRGWQEWLELRRIELSSGARSKGRNMTPELSELRARVRRLEAIANGSDR